jgi:lipopolysaccharide/colanic/teichoic acid biosynthesis glycosyltransferase
MKRVLDIMISSIGIILLSPLWIILGIMISREDPGPVFFTQRRVGRKGRHFIMYKFRSMTFSKEHTEGIFDPGDTSRVTPIGRMLRKTKLDELPQLLNVFMGDMSLVGPRPEVPAWVNAYPDKWAYILSVRPGITDNASLEFRDEEAILAKSADPETTYRYVILPRKLELYEKYVLHRSMSGDLVILYKTLIKVICN